ncbi:MAG: FtsX-like permease family protein [Ekhidna sp.]
MAHDPPKWADKLLRRICREDLLEEIQGDLHESFYWRMDTKGKRFAKRQFIKETLLSFKISNLKPYDKMDRLLTLSKSHIKTGWRFLWKTKAYSSINILGLSIGIVFSWFAYLYASDQLAYNTHIPDSENIYRMTTQVSLFDNLINLPGCSHVTTQQILDELPEVEQVARFTEDNAAMKLPEGTIDQDYLIAEKSLMDFLDLDFLEGDPGAFNAPNKVVISEKLAFKLDIRGEAVNAKIQLLDSASYVTYLVAGVYRDISKNTSIRADLILPYVHYLNQSPTNATKSSNFDLSVLMKVNAAADIEQLKANIKDLINPKKTENEYLPKLTSLASLHLSDEYFASKGFLPGGNSELIWFIVIAGLMCLLISIINYANFSISLYINRAREVAVRKIIGSANSGVFQQLMTESLLTTLLATVLAIALYALLAPQFSLLVEKQFDLSDLLSLKNLVGLSLIIISIAILSGFYPSMLLSKLKILKSLKGEQRVGKSVLVTKTLLIVQFSISIIMIASMLVFKGQLNYLVNFDRGYNVENVIKINVPTELIGSGKENVLTNHLGTIPEIQSLTSSGGYGMTAYDDGENQFSLTFKNIDTAYLEVMGIQLLEGQTLHAAKKSGIANGVLVNQSFVEKAGIGENPIGEPIDFFDNSVIVGVIKDYYAFGPVSELRPMLFFDYAEERQGFQILVKSTAPRAVLSEKMTAAWSKVFDPIPLNYDYMETLYRDKFEQEGKISKIAGLGSIIAIFISAFGLLGLVGLTIQRKLKELSIRRVMGAENRQIIWMMIKKFIAPIITSLAVGISLSYYLTEQWLADYHNRINFGWKQGTVAAMSVIVVLVLIIVVQTLKVTRTNPVVHLKDE